MLAATTPSDDTTLTNAAFLGASAGLRAFTAPGLIALRGGYGVGLAAKVLPLLAAGELAGDKLPMTPPRTAAPALAARGLSGAVLGVRCGGAQAAVAGAAVAVVAAYGGQHSRQWIGRRTGASPLLIALAEDALTLALAVRGTRGE